MEEILNSQWVQYIINIYATASSGDYSFEVVFVMFITFPMFYTFLFGITTWGVFRKGNFAMWRAFVPYTNVKAFCKLIYGEVLGIKRYQFSVMLYFSVVVFGAYVVTHFHYAVMFFPIMTGFSYYNLWCCFNFKPSVRIALGLFSAIPSCALLVTLYISLNPKKVYIGTRTEQKELQKKLETLEASLENTAESPQEQMSQPKEDKPNQKAEKAGKSEKKAV